MESIGSALAEFDALSEELLKVITTEEIKTSTRGKFVVDVIGILKSIEQERFTPSPCTKIILKNYGVRNTRNEEQKRKQNYIDGFDYEKSEAYNFISRMSPHVNYAFVVSLADKVVDCEEKHGRKLLNWCRQARRSKPGVYKFIQDNIDTFKQYFAAGTKIETD